MRVLLYHPVRMPVLRYGGTERVALWLVKTLAKKGHKVAVFAAPGSKMPEGVGCYTDPAELPKLASEFDILHAFTKPSPEIYRAFQNRVLVTIHGNGQSGERFHRNTVFLSQDHARRHGAREFVYNGIDPDELTFSDQARANRFLFLSKTSWKVKNLAGAIRMVDHARQNLWVAGGDRPYSLRTFTALKKIRGADWRWMGSIDQDVKAEFLVSGKAMVFPLLWNEPFGLVVTEALASGTPVLANACGSLPELLSFAPQCLLRSPDEWDRALRGQISLPNARECRDWVVSKFHQDIMTENYLRLYERVSAGEVLHAEEPATVGGNENQKVVL